MEPVHVVLIHWNQPERCVASVDAFRAQTVPVTITVVDNGSADPPRGLPDDLEVVEAGTNLGWGPGANVGLRPWLDDPAAGEWAVVAPHDALPEPDCLERLLEEGRRRPRAGLLSADVGDGMVPVIDRYFGPIARPVSRRTGWEPADYPHGTLLVARRACLAEIGLFDERYFAYCDEADLGERARRAGWEVGLVVGARVANPYLGGSEAVVDYLKERNTLLLVRERFGRYASFIRLVASALQLASGVLRPRSRPLVFHPRARMRAVADHLRGRYGPPSTELTSPETGDPAQ